MSKNLSRNLQSRAESVVFRMIDDVVQSSGDIVYYDVYTVSCTNIDGIWRGVLHTSMEPSLRYQVTIDPNQKEVRVEVHKVIDSLVFPD